MIMRTRIRVDGDELRVVLCCFLLRAVQLGQCWGCCGGHCFLASSFFVAFSLFLFLQGREGYQQRSKAAALIIEEVITRVQRPSREP